MRYAKTLCFDNVRQHGMPVKVARIFNTYGPHMHLNDGRVVWNFIMQALRKQDVTIYGDGQQARSFCYVDDMVDELIRLMETPPEVTGPINLGNPVETSIRSLAEHAIQATGAGTRLRNLALQADDPKQPCPDITKARELLGWEPTTELADGFARTVTYFRNLIAGGFVAGR